MIAARRAALASGALALLVALPSLRNGFVIDDAYLVMENPSIRSLANVPSFFTTTWGAGQGGSAVSGVNAPFYRPLTSVLFTLEHAAFGLHPAPWHAVSALLHWLAASLAAVLVFGLSGSGVAALAGGVLFAVHPVQAEALGPVCYQTTLLSGVLALSALIVFGGILAAGPRPRSLALLGLATLAAGFAKEGALALPGLAAAWALILRPPGWRRVLFPALAVMIGAVGVVLVARRAVLTPSDMSFFGDAPALVVVLTMVKVAGLYGELVLAPLRLCPFYDWFIVPPEGGLSSGVVVGALFLALVGGGAALALRRGERLVALGAAWFLLALAPVSQIVPIVIVAAERFLYLPLLGVALLFGVGADRLLARASGGQRVGAIAALALVLALLAARTIARLPDWHDDLALNDATANAFPQTPTPLLNLAAIHEKRGDVDAALRALEEAGRRAPGWRVPLERARRLREAPHRRQ